MEKQITGHTRLTGLLGSPVAHSISPMMHNESFAQLGLDYVYLAFDVGCEDLKTAVEMCIRDSFSVFPEDQPGQFGPSGPHKA